MPPKSKLKIKKNVNIKECVDEIENFEKIITGMFIGIPDYNVKGKKIDHRDFYYMIQCLNKTGKNKEERETNGIDQFKDMLKAFLLDDTPKVHNYLDSMYDYIDNLPNLYKKGINNNEDFKKLYICHKLGQTFSMKRGENLDYFYNRYPNPEALKKFSANMALLDQTLYDLSVLYDENENVKFPGVSDMEITLDYQLDIVADFTFNFSKALNENKNEFTFKVPSFYDYSLNASCTEEQQTHTKLYDNIIRNSYTSYIGVEDIEINDRMTVDSTEYTFIGDKSLKEVALEKLRDNPVYKNADADNKRFYLDKQIRIELDKAFVKGDQVISVVTPIKKNGLIEFTETRIKPDVSNLEPTVEEINQHSWLRRKLSSWGIFKIKKDQSAIDKLYKNAPKINQTIIDKATAQFEKERETYVSKKSTEDKENNLEQNKINAYNYLEKNGLINQDIELGNQIDKDLQDTQSYISVEILDNEQTYKHRVDENSKEL